MHRQPGLCPGGVDNSTPPDPPAEFEGATKREREGKGREGNTVEEKGGERDGEGKGKKRGRAGRKREGKGMDEMGGRGEGESHTLQFCQLESSTVLI